jgi:nitroreductase
MPGQDHSLADAAVSDLFLERWSPHAFADKPLPPGAITTILDAARWSASSHNEQPWRYLVVTKDHPEEFNRLSACLSDNNRRWAPRAPALLLASYRRTHSDDGEPNRHAQHDLGQANSALALQAAALGLAIRPMGAFNRDAARAAFAIPEEYQPWLVLAFGWPGTPDQLPNDLQELEQAPRRRRPLGEIAFDGQWGKPLGG